jgi:nucleotide-binding universal stress UspA family protein
MKQILCVVDLTESTGRVLDVSATIATACRAHLRILYPYRLLSFGYDGNMTGVRQRLEAEARKKFEDFKQHVPTLDSVSYEFLPEIGFLSDRINAHVNRHDVDMIIISQDQSDDKKNFDLQEFIRQAQLPFIIVPASLHEISKT